MRFRGISRRDFLSAGAAGIVGLNRPLAGLVSAMPTRPNTGRAKSVILLWLDGGPSQYDTFDPKPYASVGVRSDARPIRTTVTGLQISELMPLMARQMHHCTLFRGVSHDEWTHEGACHTLLTGRRPSSSLVYPSLGSVVAMESDSVGTIPRYVSIPDDTFGFGHVCGGFLDSAFNPLPVTVDMGASHFSTAVGSAHNIDLEPLRVRERYGPHRFGQECLLARKLVESGVRFVTVNLSGWDTHCDIAAAARDRLVPTLDRGLAALIEDLHQRGLLEQTLVLCMGEFGRSPKINALGGRDHWPRAGFLLSAGAGIPRGQVVGTTDHQGAEPLDRIVSPQDIAVSVFRKLGIDPGKTYRTPDHPRMSLADGGEYIEELG